MGNRHSISGSNTNNLSHEITNNSDSYNNGNSYSYDINSSSSVADDFIDKQLINIPDNKHDKYTKYYKPNDTYWGCGIENETYFIFESQLKVKGKDIKLCNKRERYSIDYYRNFDSDKLENFYQIIEDNSYYKVPIYLNAHFFQKCDKNGEHSTLYTRPPQKINPKYLGESIHSLLIDESVPAQDMYEKTFVYDGDSIEIITNNFYKNTVDDCINELVNSKRILLYSINEVFSSNKIFTKYDKVLYQDHNYGLCKQITNLNNLSICNNGTYHFNFVLPTKLNKKCEIKNPKKFIKIHQNAIRAIQWLEPLFVALYGSPDFFSTSSEYFAGGSQRCALSRYIGVGTYDTKTMIRGKLLDTFDPRSNPNLWYNSYHKTSGYICPSTIGFDINFNKFTNHGIEIRFFDYFPEAYLQSVMNVIVLACELSIKKKKIPIATELECWNRQTINSVSMGSDGGIDVEYVKAISKAFGIKIKGNNLRELFQCIADELFLKYSDGKFAKRISPSMPRPIIINHNENERKFNKNMLFM